VTMGVEQATQIPTITLTAMGATTTPILMDRLTTTVAKVLVPTPRLVVNLLKNKLIFLSPYQSWKGY